VARNIPRPKPAPARSRSSVPAPSTAKSSGATGATGATGSTGSSAASSAAAGAGASQLGKSQLGKSNLGKSNLGASAGLPPAALGSKGRAASKLTRAASTASRSGLQRREADTRERILQAGAELVGAKGFNGCGLSEILAQAQVPKGSFYHYFASKEDFGVALIERARDEYLDELRQHLTDRRRSAVGRLRSIFEDTRNECARNGPTVECLIPKLALETATLSAPVHAAVKCSYEQWSAIIAQVVREGQASGEIDRSHDPDRLARVLVMLWEGAAVRMQIDRSIQPLDDFLAFVFDTLLRPGGRAGN